MRLARLAALSIAMFFFAAPSASADQEIKPFARGSYQQIISTRQGKPFIVNFWSLTCSYCMVELNILRKLSKKYPKLDLVLVSTDTPEEEESVAATLAKSAPNRAETWLFADSFADRLRFDVDKDWQGELPRTYFFGVNGKVIAVSGKVEEKDVELWVKEQYSLR